MQPEVHWLDTNKDRVTLSMVLAPKGAGMINSTPNAPPEEEGPVASSQSWLVRLVADDWKKPGAPVATGLPGPVNQLSIPKGMVITHTRGIKLVAVTASTTPAMLAITNASTNTNIGTARGGDERTPIGSNASEVAVRSRSALGRPRASCNAQQKHLLPHA